MTDLGPLHQFYQIFMEQSDDGIWMAEIDPPVPTNSALEEQFHNLFVHALLKRCNLAFVHMYGFKSTAELLGTPILRFITRDDPQNIEVLRKFLQPPHIVREAETHEKHQQTVI